MYCEDSMRPGLLRDLKSNNVQYNVNGAYVHKWPAPPSFSNQCQVNLDYDTLDPRWPNRSTTLGSNSLKRLYMSNGILPSGKVVPFYPMQTMDLPCDTLYGSDTSVYTPWGERRTYGAKLYPYTNRSPREFREYGGQLVPVNSRGVLPLPAIEAWTRFPISTPEGTAGVLMP